VQHHLHHCQQGILVLTQHLHPAQNGTARLSMAHKDTVKTTQHNQATAKHCLWYMWLVQFNLLVVLQHRRTLLQQGTTSMHPTTRDMTDTLDMLDKLSGCVTA
jgi:hypothetical protein